MDWLPPPEPGTSVCGGFDGSESDDWTVIRLETAAGYQFTPRWKASGEPMVWNPAQHGGRMPRLQVHDAWAEIAEGYRIERIYCDPGFNDPHDPTSWISEIETWERLYGPDRFLPWQMGGQTRTRAVHASIVRFETDLALLQEVVSIPRSILLRFQVALGVGVSRTSAIAAPRPFSEIGVRSMSIATLATNCS